MITYDDTGLTLMGTRANGTKFSHYFMEGAPFNAMVQTRDAQLQALRENTAARQTYETALASTQLSVDAGRPANAPMKPLMKVVSDEGDVSMAPFDPPLADLVAPTVTPTAGSLKTSAPDDAHRAEVQYAMIRMIFQKLFPGVQV